MAPDCNFKGVGLGPQILAPWMASHPSKSRKSYLQMKLEAKGMHVNHKQVYRCIGKRD